MAHLQADVEPWQGLHAKATGEYGDDDFADDRAVNPRGGGPVRWFVAPHLVPRLVALHGSPGDPGAFLGLVQAHAWLQGPTMLLLVGTLLAASGYPSELEARVGMPCEPTCLLCHSGAVGGAGTVTQPFGAAMMAAGRTGGSDLDALGAALDAVDAAAVDSDGDAVFDVDELVEGTNPNPGREDFCSVPAPEYGCFRGRAAGVFLVGIGFGGLVRRRP